MGEPRILRPDGAGITEAADLLRAGELVALPTETVYGLAARADGEAAVAAIYRAKGRPDFNPLIVHVGRLDAARALAHMDARAERLAARYWPGPLTLVLPSRQGNEIAPAVTAGLPTIALRMPHHEVALAVLRLSGLPLAAPSANRSGAVSPTCAEHVQYSLGGGVAAILDGGACPTGLESTIVALREDDGWNLLRPGAVTLAELEAELGPEGETTGEGIEAPGQLVRHYSPGKPMRLDARQACKGEFLIGFGEVAGDCSLSESGELAEAAARLYACLHLAAAAPQRHIAVAPIPAEGLGAAIRDRLQRAAA